MANEQNLTPFKPGQVANPNGRPKGSKNRSTIARMVLDMEIIVPGDIYDHFIKQYPKMPKVMSTEMLATLQVMRRAIHDGEYLHYKAIVDSAYGAPKQEIDMTSDGERINPTINITNSIAPLSTSEKDVNLD